MGSIFRKVGCYLFGCRTCPGDRRDVRSCSFVIPPVIWQTSVKILSWCWHESPLCERKGHTTPTSKNCRQLKSALDLASHHPHLVKKQNKEITLYTSRGGSLYWKGERRRNPICRYRNPKKSSTCQHQEINQEVVNGTRVHFSPHAVIC